MDIHEYQAKEILAGFGVDVPPGALRGMLNGHEVTKRVTSYGHADGAALVVLGSSDGALEVASPGGNAAQLTGAERGCPVEVSW